MICPTRNLFSPYINAIFDSCLEVFPSSGEVASLEHEETAKIVKINLKQEYLKIQRKKVEGSQQRIQDAMVYFTVRSELVILNVQTYVQRFSDWIDDIMFNKPDNGKIGG